MENTSQEIRNGVDELFERFGEHITSNHKLLLLYWQFIDGIDMDSKTISTPDWLQNSTDPIDIINALWLKQAIDGKRYF